MHSTVNFIWCKKKAKTTTDLFTIFDLLHYCQLMFICVGVLLLLVLLFCLIMSNISKYFRDFG